MDKPLPLLQTLDERIAALPDMGRMSLEELQRRAGTDKFYRLSSNESAYGPSPLVVEAIKAHAASIGFYPPMTDLVLREALSQTLGRGLTAEHFFTGSSGYESLELVARAFLKADDEIIVTHPTFPVYDRIALLQSAKVVNVPLKGSDFAWDIDGILAAVTSRTKLVIICNPNNPTGTLLPKTQMDRLVHEMPDHVLIVADEVYFHFVTDPYYPDSIQYVLDNRNLVIIHTFSKGYGMAGMRLGYGIAMPEISHYIRRFHRGFHQNKLQIEAGVVALSDPVHLQKNIDAVVQGREFLYEQFDRLDLRYWKTQGNFLLVELPYQAVEIADKLLGYGVQVRPMMGDLARCLRVTVAAPEANEAFVRSLEDVLGGMLV